MNTTLKYQIKSCLSQADRISKEYPNVGKVEFTIKDASYQDVKDIATERNREVTIANGVGLILVTEGIGYVFVYTKPLIVSEPIIVEG
jgi:hypothetical protein